MRHKREHVPWAEWKVMHRRVEYLNSLVKEIHHWHEFENFQKWVKCTSGKYSLRQRLEPSTQELCRVLWKWSLGKAPTCPCSRHPPAECPFPCCRSQGGGVLEQGWCHLLGAAGRSESVLQVCEVSWCLLRNPAEFLLNYSPECQRAFAHTEWALARAAPGGNKKAMCAHPLKLVCPHSFSLHQHNCWTLSSGGLSGGLDDRILHVCVSKGICDLRTHLMKCFFFLTVPMK